MSLHLPLNKQRNAHLNLNLDNIEHLNGDFLIRSFPYRSHVFAFHLILSDEPEHLHDPPLLKYIPHLWPGGGVDGAGVTVDHGGDSVGNGDYDGGELGMEVMALWCYTCCK